MNATTQTTVFANLFAAIVAEKEKDFQRFLSDLSELNRVEDILKPYNHYSYLLPDSKKKHKWANVDELKTYLIAREQKKNNKELNRELTHLQAVSEAPDLVSITCTVEWKKSRMWGSNPRCEAEITTTGRYERFDSGSIGGCGYDKNSTAIANALNQSYSFLKALYTVKEYALMNGNTKKNRELFGYGSGYGILPSLEGGVGVSCYPAIFEKIGLKWRNTASGKTFDVYTAEK